MKCISLRIMIYLQCYYMREFIYALIFLIMNRQNNNCMIILSSGYDPSALQKYTSLPGEVYDANSQCQHINGPGSSLCKVEIGERQEIRHFILSIRENVNDTENFIYS